MLEEFHGFGYELRVQHFGDWHAITRIPNRNPVQCGDLNNESTLVVGDNMPPKHILALQRALVVHKQTAVEATARL